MAPQAVDADLGRAKVDACGGQVAHFVHDGRDVQQRLGRNAAHVQADAAQCRVTLDQHHLEAKVSRAESGRVAAWATAEHQQVAVHIGSAGEAGRY